MFGYYLTLLKLPVGQRVLSEFAVPGMPMLYTLSQSSISFGWSSVSSGGHLEITTESGAG
jgi:hypothetical protein